MSEKDHDIKRIEKLLAIMKANDLVEIKIKSGDDKIVLKRAGASAGPAIIAGAPMMAPAPALAAPATCDAAEPAARDSSLLEITSPLVGTFYATPSPDSDPFVEPGTPVDASTVVCIIEAMKVMNEIKAEVSGTIVEVLCSNGQAVEYGQPLFKVRPD